MCASSFMAFSAFNFADIASLSITNETGKVVDLTTLVEPTIDDSSSTGKGTGKV